MVDCWAHGGEGNKFVAPSHQLLSERNGTLSLLRKRYMTFPCLAQGVMSSFNPKMYVYGMYKYHNFSLNIIKAYNVSCI